MNNKEKGKEAVSDKEKLEYVLKELFEGLDLLFVSIRNLYKEDEREDKKVYFIISGLLLCFCFLDFLRRFDYIFKNGKDGNEDKHNRDKYTSFLDSFVMGNDKYGEYDYSFTADDLYEIRNDLVHSFSLKNSYDDGKKIILFIGGDIADNKEILNRFKEIIKNKYPLAEKIHIIAMRAFLEIIKEGLSKMLKEYESLLLEETKQNAPKRLINHLDDLYRELKNTTRHYLGIKRPK